MVTSPRLPLSRGGMFSPRPPPSPGDDQHGKHSRAMGNAFIFLLRKGAYIYTHHKHLCGGQRATDRSQSGKQQKESPTRTRVGIYQESTRPAPPPNAPGGEQERGADSRGRSPRGPRAPRSSRAHAGAFPPRALQCASIPGTRGGGPGGGAGGLGNSFEAGGAGCPRMGTQRGNGSLQRWRGGHESARGRCANSGPRCRSNQRIVAEVKEPELSRRRLCRGRGWGEGVPAQRAGGSAGEKGKGGQGKEDALVCSQGSVLCRGPAGQRFCAGQEQSVHRKRICTRQWEAALRKGERRAAGRARPGP